MFDFWDYAANPEYYDDLNALVAGKVKDENKRVKGVNKNIVDKTNHNEYKDVLTNKRCLRYLIQRTQNKNH